MAKINGDQQVVLDWMKKELTNWGVNDLFFELAFLSFDGGLIKNEITARAYRGLSDFERLQVLQAFAEWGLRQYV